jgi:SAM-dependent methyltransferase
MSGMPVTSFASTSRTSTRNWSEDLEEFHEESSLSHPIELLTRGAILSHLGALSPAATLIEIGCSTGHLLQDLRATHPSVRLIGLDLILSGLRKARATQPDVVLAQADACHLPIADSSADAVLSVNLLEHVPDDMMALSEIRRVLRPGGKAVLVVPVAPGLYDYYDRFLQHERRYARGEMTSKARKAGLDVEEDLHLGSVVFPAFWMAKKANRLRFDHLAGLELEEKVRRDYGQTAQSPIFGLACRMERWLLNNGARPPFGIRGLTVVRRPLQGD